MTWVRNAFRFEGNAEENSAMKIWIASDLHLEFGEPFDPTPPADADVMVCAGDILTKGICPSIKWLAEKVAPLIPVVFVSGNHEYYGASMIESMRAARELADSYPSFHFLENDAVDIDDVRFVGATLWTDYRLVGEPAFAMEKAKTGMNDFRRIKFSKLPYQKFRPIHAFRKHQESRDFIASQLSDGGRRKTVVVTHHAPSARSVPPVFRDDPLSGCYASHLENLVLETQPTLWVHGHVHGRNDYLIGEARVISNSRGYPGEFPDFDPMFIVEV